MEASPAQAQRILLKSSLNQSEIATLLGCSQSQISRIASGRARRKSALVRKICANMHKLLPVYRLRQAGAEAGHEARLREALLAVWDGTDTQANALVEILSGLKSFSVSTKS